MTDDQQNQNQGDTQPTPPTPPVPPADQGAGQAQPAGTQSTSQTTPPDPNSRSGQLGPRDKHIFTIPAHPNTTFDEENFLILLEGSISLTMEEKKRVIDAIPRLKIEQINELIKIFEEEKQKFSELEKEFSDDVAKLKKEREKEIQLGEIKQEEQAESASEEAEAEALRKKLMG
ncbi:hypothetical protein K9M41_00735 [Candidatus Gracilibacteria bacterium]|nr:hypothetical protein [Candidatus Gracilibacteria bacterium]